MNWMRESGVESKRDVRLISPRHRGWLCPPGQPLVGLRFKAVHTGAVHKFRHAWRGLFRVGIIPSFLRHAHFSSFGMLTVFYCYLLISSIFWARVMLNVWCSRQRNAQKCSSIYNPLSILTRDAIYERPLAKKAFKAKPSKEHTQRVEGCDFSPIECRFWLQSVAIIPYQWFVSMQTYKSIRA